MILAGDSREGVARAHGVVAHCGSLCRGTRLSLFLCLLFGKDAVFLIGTENLVLVVHFLHIALVGIEIPVANLEKTVAECSRLKIYEPCGVKSRALVPGLKMQVRARRTPCRAAKADDISGAYPVPGIDIPSGKMRIEGLEAVCVAYYHQVSITANVV